MENKISSNSGVKVILKEKIKKIDFPHKDSYIYLVGPIELPVTLYGKTINFKWYSWVEMNNNIDVLEGNVEDLINYIQKNQSNSSVLTFGDFKNEENALVRFHSICHTGDVFGSQKCDCGFQLKESLAIIAENKAGALFYLADHEGRGIGLFNKAITYIFQENGYDTVESNHLLGFKDDLRDYDEAATVLKFLREKPINLLTNNPLKIRSLEKNGIEIKNRIELWGGYTKHNKNYLKIKIKKSNHII